MLLGLGVMATMAQLDALEQVAQDLVLALAVVAMIGLAEEGRQLGLGDQLETGQCQQLEHVIILELEGDLELAQNHVVVETLFRRRLGAFALATTHVDQAIEEPGQVDVLDALLSLIIIALEPIADLGA